MIANDTKQILKKYDQYAKKMYGQNFLVDKNILEAIIKEANVTGDMGVIEIGPGLGALTEFLAIHAKKVLTYEIDDAMVEILSETIAPYSNVHVKHIDFLKANVEEDIKLYLNDVRKVVVVANLPYYITTPIIFKFLEETSIDSFLFMVQKEVAQRLTGKPNTKDYNALSVLMEYKTRSKMVRIVPPKCFYPEPKVESALLSIITVQSDYGVENEPKFLRFIQLIFAQRRKTIVNNLATGYGLNKLEVANKLEKMGYSPSIRAEALTIKDYVKIYKNLFE